MTTIITQDLVDATEQAIFKEIDGLLEEFRSSWKGMTPIQSFTDEQHDLMETTVRSAVDTALSNLDGFVDNSWVEDELLDAETEAQAEKFGKGLDAIAYMDEEGRRDFAHFILEM